MSENFRRVSEELEYMDPDSLKRLERTLSNMDRGNSVDFRTPFWNKEDRAVILANMEAEVGYADIPLLQELDEQEKSKVGPFSIRLPWNERRENLLQYSSQKFSPNVECWDKAFNRVSSFLRPNSLRRSNLETAYSLMPKGTSLGLPYVTSDKTYLPKYLERARHRDSFKPFIGYTRTQPKGLNEPPKQRLVWGADHAETIIGATFWYPFLKEIRKLQGFSAWVSPDEVDKSMTRMLHRADGRKLISADYSSYDASLHHMYMETIMNLFRYWFSSGDDDLNMLLEYATTGPIVVPYEVWKDREGGIPSGMVLTSAFGSLGNILAGFYAAERLRVELEDFEVMGDDSVFLFSVDVPIDELSDVMAEIGLEFNTEKQFVHTDAVHFLQRLHMLDYLKGNKCVGIHSIYRSMSSATGYERMTNPNVWNGWMDTIRLYMLANVCSSHPLFEKWLRFLATGDRNFGIDPLYVAKRAGGVSKIAEVLRLPSYPFNQKDISGLEGFEITRIIRSWK